LGLLSGGILIFQGWRLDPILLFGQMLSSGTAIFFILESIKLRSLNDNKKEIRQKYLDVQQKIVNSTNESIQELNQTQKKNKKNFSQELKYTDPQEYPKGSELTKNSFFRD
jgi:beta-galactosidase beta subunit